MSSPAVRYSNLQRRTKIVEEFCAKYDFELVPLNNGYQLRIEGVLDAYPVNGYWCYMPDGERGSWRTGEDLRKILLRKLPAQRKGDPTKYVAKPTVRPFTKAELGALYEDASRIAVDPTPPHDDAVNAMAYTFQNVKTMTQEQYDKWYRRLWRWIRSRG